MIDNLRSVRVAEVPVLLDGKPFTLIPPGPGRVPCVSLCMAHGIEGWYPRPVEADPSVAVKFKSVVFQSLEHQQLAGYGHVASVPGFEVNPDLFLNR